MTSKMRKSIGLLCATALTLGATLAPAEMASAATVSAKQSEIVINGSVLSRPSAFIVHNTTYMPLTAVMQLMAKLQLHNHWNGVSRVWDVTDPQYSANTSTLRLPTVGHLTITVNHNPVVDNVIRLVRKDPRTGQFTTYVPIYYVMQLLKRLSIQNQWNGAAWTVQAGSTTTTASTDTGSVVGTTTGTSSASTSSQTSSSGGNGASSSSGTSSQGSGTSATTPVTTGTAVSVGATATVQGSGSASAAVLPIGTLPSSGLPTLEGQAVPTVTLQNQATSDAVYWQRASEAFFISAQDTSPTASASTQNTRIVSAKPGQMLYLFAYDNSHNITPLQTIWHVNSPDALITTDTVDEWSGGPNNKQQTLAYFTPTKPGIYTIQAQTGDLYSVPIVITVGLSSLQSQPFSLPTQYTGIMPLPTDLSSVAAQSDGAVTYLPYSAQGDWIPVAGTVSGSFANKVKAVTVVLNGATPAQEWDYRLPVDSSGHFGALVESPFTGNVSVSLMKNYLTLMTQSSTNFSYPIDYQVTVSGQTPSAQLQALLPSSAMDYNMSPQFTTVADTLLENSTSLEGAIAAINNYVAGDISYNNAELAPNAQYIFTDALTTWNEQLGVCENMAQLGAALLRSVGIPTQTVGGYANSAWTKPDFKDTNANDAHEWLNVWNGTKWQPFDPTWTAIEDASGLGYGITSEFSTDTTSLAATHAQVADQIATSMSKR